MVIRIVVTITIIILILIGILIMLIILHLIFVNFLTITGMRNGLEFWHAITPRFVIQPWSEAPDSKNGMATLE